jgi:CRISPR/Cas system-associated exonuclease Cas4 (RecB family)
MFTHIDINLPQLERETIDGVRYYKVPEGDELLRLVSITSVTSHKNRQFFADWRKKVGEEKANKITKQATSRGTDMHTLAENYLKNEEFSSEVLPISQMLFGITKPYLNKINNIHALENSLYSKVLGIAGTVDCIAEYNGELAVIDFKTSKKPKPRDWIEHYFVQCAAYACMLYEMTGIMVKKFVIIMACENGECEIYEEYDKGKYIKLLTEYIREFVRDKLQQYE